MKWINVNDKLPEYNQDFWGLEYHKDDWPIGYRIHGLECWKRPDGILYGFNNDGMGEGSQVWLFEVKKDALEWLSEDQSIEWWMPVGGINEPR